MAPNLFMYVVVSRPGTMVPSYSTTQTYSQPSIPEPCSYSVIKFLLRLASPLIVNLYRFSQADKYVLTLFEVCKATLEARLLCETTKFHLALPLSGA